MPHAATLMSTILWILREAGRIAVALALGGTGAALFTFLHFPAPFLTGPAVAVTLAVLAGARLGIPMPLRDACFLVLGIGIGTSVTPEVLAAAATWPLSFALLTLTLLSSIMASRDLLARRFGFGRLPVLLAATPGHLSFVLGLSAELRSDVPRIAVVQSMRVLFLTLLVSLLLNAWGVEGSAATPDPQPMAMLPMAALVAHLMKRAGLPAAWLLGGMSVSALGHATMLSPACCLIGLPWVPLL